MRDRYYIDSKTGARIPVAVLPTCLIEELLTMPLHVDGTNGDEAVDDIRERLRIELVARKLEGRL